MVLRRIVRCLTVRKSPWVVGANFGVYASVDTLPSIEVGAWASQ
jgi:hypothetical protein